MSRNKIALTTIIAILMVLVISSLSLGEESNNAPLVPLTSSTEISSCGILDKPGETYMLAANIIAEGDCFTINANNIILDGNGHSISGPGPEAGIGISVSSETSVIIRNLAINSFNRGISAPLAKKIEIRNNEITGSFYGIIIQEGEEITISDNALSENVDSGIYLDSVSRAVITNNELSSSEVGINLIESNDNTLEKNAVLAHDRGVLLVTSNSNTILDTSGNGNTFGIALELNSANNIIRGADFESTGQSDIGAAIAIAGPDNLIEDVNIQRYYYDAIQFFESSSVRNKLNSITISNNGIASGYDLRFANAGSTSEAAGVDGNHILDSSIGNYYITSSGGKLIMENTQYGKIEFTSAVNGEGQSLTNDLSFANNKIKISEEQAGLNSPAILTFYNAPSLTSYALLRNGKACNACVYQSSSAPNTAKFTVPGAGDYEIYLDPLGPPANSSQNNSNSSDNLAPSVTILSPINNNLYANYSIPLKFKLNEPGNCNYQIAGEQSSISMQPNVSKTEFNALHTFSASGNYTIQALCEDNATNINHSKSVAIRVEVNSISSPGEPMSILSPTNSTYTATSLEIKVALNSSGSCSYSLDGNPNKTLSSPDGITFTSTESNLATGSHKIESFCLLNNSLSNQIKKSVVFTVNLPSTASPSSSPSSSRGSRGGSSGGGSIIVNLPAYEKNYTNCQTKWQCTQWGECVNGIQTRICDKEITRCSQVIGDKPDENRFCIPHMGSLFNFDNNNETTNSSIESNVSQNFITGAVIGTISQNKKRIVGFLVLLLILSVIFSFIIGKIKKRKKIKSQVS